jgi:hypothetical protein
MQQHFLYASVKIFVSSPPWYNTRSHTHPSPLETLQHLMVCQTVTLNFNPSLYNFRAKNCKVHTELYIENSSLTGLFRSTFKD